MQILITAGRLVSTSDIKLAAKLGQLVTIQECTGNRTPRALRQSNGTISFLHGTEYFELATV